MDGHIGACRQRWSRSLLVAAVLWAVLAMHGLSAGHDAMQMQTFTPSSSSVLTTAGLHLPAGPSAGDTMSETCLAVIAVAAGLIIVLHGLLRRPWLRAMDRSAAARGGPPRRAVRRFSLSLTQLGICRT